MFWDHVAGVYDIFAHVINRKAHKALRKVVADLIEPEDTVLECACGTGLLSAVIAEQCASLTATDLSKKMLTRAKKNCAGFPNITFAWADITALEYPDVQVSLAEGRVPCAVAVIKNREDERHEVSGRILGAVRADDQKEYRKAL